MFKKIVFIVILCLGLVFIGCAGQSCIKIGGNITDENGQSAGGEIEYCYSPKASQVIGYPTFLDSGSNISVLIPEKEIKEPEKKETEPKNIKTKYELVREKIKLLLK